MKQIQVVRALFGVLLTLLAAANLVAAQNPPRITPASQNENKARLKLVVILSRHGVRPPTWPQERLDAYSALPWPKWNVPPGYLTPHGYDLLKRFGKFDRVSYAEEGLFAAKGCSDAAATYTWADTDQRTMESGRALAEGLFPGCPPVVRSLAAGEHDLLFHPVSRRSQAEDGQSKEIALEKVPAPLADLQLNELAAEMQHVLMGCSPLLTCTPLQVAGDSVAQRRRDSRGSGSDGAGIKLRRRLSARVLRGNAGERCRVGQGG